MAQGGACTFAGLIRQEQEKLRARRLTAIPRNLGNERFSISEPVGRWMRRDRIVT